MLDSQQLFVAVLRFQSFHELFDDDFPFYAKLLVSNIFDKMSVKHPSYDIQKIPVD